MLGGLPTPLDPFEARRILLTLLLVSAVASAEVTPSESGPTGRTRAPSVARGAARRRHVRPARSC